MAKGVQHPTVEVTGDAKVIDGAGHIDVLINLLVEFDGQAQELNAYTDFWGDGRSGGYRLLEAYGLGYIFEPGDVREQAGAHLRMTSKNGGFVLRQGLAAPGF